MKVVMVKKKREKRMTKTEFDGRLECDGLTSVVPCMRTPAF